jgi:hypothetical protein
MKKNPPKDDDKTTLLRQSSSRNQDIELVPDAWPRFEKFIREIAKAGPQHRVPITKSKGHKPKKKAPQKPGPNV